MASVAIFAVVTFASNILAVVTALLSIAAFNTTFPEPLKLTALAVIPPPVILNALFVVKVAVVVAVLALPVTLPVNAPMKVPATNVSVSTVHLSIPSFQTKLLFVWVPLSIIIPAS